ncbi:DUF742 domain-containing protein [Actinophytocola sp.]|uniref:DUF742 domain-containing protein n=1 Tax=Actinophytocola sp. TaxID=1872138 RepID=UPI002ED2BE8F
MSVEDGPESAEGTFADVFNGLMGVSKPRKRPHARQEPRPPRHQQQPQPEPPPEETYEENAASVRAYAWTGGRTRADAKLEIETLISTTQRAEETLHTMRSEHQAVARLCRNATSVAEIGALLSLPLGVVRVLLNDMAELGFVTVHNNEQTTADGAPDMDLLKRVLRGLTNLRT